MKKNDIAMIVVIAAICLIASYLIVSAVFMQNKPNEAKVHVVDLIKSDVADPDKNVFNKDAINPAVQVFIGREGQNSNNSEQGTEAKK